MMRLRALQLFLLCILSAASVLANAATAEAQQVTYFNEAGVVIGYQYLDCGNSARHAGTLNSPYSVIQHWRCPDSTTTCVWQPFKESAGNWTCVPASASTIYDNVSFIHTADGISAQQFCTDQVPGNVYETTLPCSATAPEILTGFSPVNGWN